MLSQGYISDSHLSSALLAQQNSGAGRIGEWLERLGFATEQQVTAALALQWACPLLPRFVADETCESLLPLAWMERFHMLPVHFGATSRVFFIACSEGIEYRALQGIEQVLGCRTETCVVAGSVMERELERCRLRRRLCDLIFEGEKDAAEMTRITCGYMLKLRPAQMRVTACGGLTWARLATGQQTANLIFRTT